VTWRAVLAGLVAGAFVCAFCYFNDNVMRQTMFIGNSMPISVYGGLILFVLLINPLLKRWAFSAGELAVALALVSVMCTVPSLMRTFTAIRLRWPKWPLHPVLFLIWNTYGGRVFAASFLGGWGIKVLVTQYAGASWYQRLKPLMFGLIAGEMLGGLVPIAIGFVYWLATGLPPKVFNILPP